MIYYNCNKILKEKKERNVFSYYILSFTHTLLHRLIPPPSRTPLQIPQKNLPFLPLDFLQTTNPNLLHRMRRRSANGKLRFGRRFGRRRIEETKLDWT